MIAAAGILIVAPDPVSGADTALMLLRGPGSDHPFEWAFPGGRLEGEETTAEAAVRETLEECGLDVDVSALGLPLTRGVAVASVALPALCPCCNGSPCQCPPTCSGCNCNAAPASESVDFTTYLHRVKKQFTPTLCDEHVGYCWTPLDRPPQPTHPGATVALERPKMDELGVARAIAAGRLVSPQFYENMALFAIRITATGVAYRTKLGEYVWRPPDLYLNQEFLDRCSGLPVIWEHPKETSLNTKEYAERTIGAVMFAYVDGKDVWAIARVYDEPAARMMIENQISTSPAVVFKDKTANERATLEDGSKVLVEGKPDLLDHIAICKAGVWDKGGEPTGVDRSAVMEPGTIADSEPAVVMADSVTDLNNSIRARRLSLRARSLGLLARH